MCHWLIWPDVVFDNSDPLEEVAKTSKGGVTSLFISISLAVVLFSSYSYTVATAWWVTLASFVFVAVNCHAVISKMTLMWLICNQKVCPEVWHILYTCIHWCGDLKLRCSFLKCQAQWIRFDKRLFKYGKHDYNVNLLFTVVHCCLAFVFFLFYCLHFFVLTISPFYIV